MTAHQLRTIVAAAELEEIHAFHFFPDAMNQRFWTLEVELEDLVERDLQDEL